MLFHLAEGARPLALTKRQAVSALGSSKLVARSSGPADTLEMSGSSSCDRAVISSSTPRQLKPPTGGFSAASNHLSCQANVAKETASLRMREHTDQSLRRAIHPALPLDRRVADQQRREIAVRFLRAWLSWSDARLSKASSELEKLGWLGRKASITPAGDCAATEWMLPQSSSRPAKRSAWRGCPIRDTVSRVRTRCPIRDKADHISRTHKKGDRARTREHEAEQRRRRALRFCPRLSGFRSKGVWAKSKPSLLTLVGRRKRRAAQAFFDEQCRHHSALGWTEPRRPNGSMSERTFCLNKSRRLTDRAQHLTPNESANTATRDVSGTVNHSRQFPAFPLWKFNRSSSENRKTRSREKAA